VFLIIMPSQRAFIAAIEAGNQPNPELAIRAKHRSTHNNYLTLPVLFCMLSNHSAFVFNHPQAWALVPIISAIAALARHYFNLKHQGKNRPAVLLVAAILFIAVAIAANLTRSPPLTSDTTASAQAVQVVISKHCTSCHAQKPTFAGYATPPGGYVFETPADLHEQPDRVISSVSSNYMPLANMTGITQQERALLVSWVTAGP